MKKMFLFTPHFLMFFILIVFLGCEGPQGEIGPVGPAGIKGEDGTQGPPGLDGNSDKQIRIDLPGSFGANDTTWNLDESYNEIIKFNAHNYTGVDSVILVASLYTYDSTANCIFELYNMTDNQPILNSQIQTNSTTFNWYISNNIFSSFPNKEITIRGRIKSSVNGISVQKIRSYILLYRK